MFCPHCSIILMIPLAFDEKFAFSANAYTPCFGEKRKFERRREICFFRFLGNSRAPLSLSRKKKRRLTSAGMYNTDCFSLSHFVWGPTQHDFWHQTKPPKTGRGKRRATTPAGTNDLLVKAAALLTTSPHKLMAKKTTLPHLSAPINGDAAVCNLGIKFRWLGPSPFFHSEFFLPEGRRRLPMCFYNAHRAPALLPIHSSRVGRNNCQSEAEKMAGPSVTATNNFFPRRRRRKKEEAK